MKTLSTWMLCSLAFGGAAWAQANDTPQVLGTAKTYSTAPGSNYERDVTAMSDGSLRGTVRDGSVVTHVDITVKNGQAVIVSRNPWGVSTSVNSLAAYKAFAQAHPDEVAAVDRQANQFKLDLAKHERTVYGVSPMAGQCTAQYNAMIQAGDNAIAACAVNGESQQCVEASNAWHAADEASNACMNTPAKGKGGN